MLTLFINNFYYRTLKSGFLLDFFFKKITLKFLTLQFFFYNLFIEKYYVEFIFLRVKDYLYICVAWVDSYSEEFAFSALSIFLLIVLSFLLFS